MRAFVTGARGFVGHHLMHHLTESGDDVVPMDRIAPGSDIADGDRMREVSGSSQPDVVYHLAGWSDVGGSWVADREVLRVNAEGTLSVLLACLHSRGERVVVVSSADVYGIVTDADLPLTEDAPFRPVSPYAASKAAADLIALQAFLGRGLGVIRVRAFNHLGPGQSDNFVAPAIASRIARNEIDGSDVVPVGN